MSSLKVSIVPSDSPDNPRHNFDCYLGTFAMAHRRYSFGDKDSPTTPEGIAEASKGARIVLPVVMYDHSGQTINTTGFSGPWDSGRIGSIWVTDDDIKKAYGVQEIDLETENKARKALIAEIAELDQWLTGDVWDVMIVDSEDWPVDSLGMVYGREYAEAEAATMLAAAQEGTR